MSRNNTGNPIGSKAFPDFEDNVKNLDEAVNTADPQWVDRFGRSRLPLMEQERRFIASQDSREDQFQSSQDSREGLFQSAQSYREDVFSDFLQGSGYQDLGEYAPGIEITAHNQYVTFDGQPYLLKPSIPVPYTTSGGWTGDDFKLIGDDSLRQDLANPGIGALMVRGAAIYVNTVADLQALDTSALVDGQIAIVQGVEFKYDGAQWQNLSGAFSPEMFNGSLFDAAERVKTDTAYWLLLKGNKTYEYTGTTKIYLPRMKCNNGVAAIKFPNDVDIGLDFLGTSDVIKIKNVKMLFGSNRTSPTSAGIRVFKDAAFVESSHIDGLEVRGLTNINDESTWSDDVGRTRLALNLVIFVSEIATLKNARHYGVSSFYRVDSQEKTAEHYENNVIGFNNETNVFVSGYGAGGFTRGKSSDIKTVNTAEQKGYHAAMSSGVTIQGKNTILVEKEADHTFEYEVSGVSGINCVERVAYIQTQANVSDMYSKDCGGLHIKNGTPSDPIVGARLTGRTVEITDDYFQSHAPISVTDTGYNCIDFRAKGINHRYNASTLALDRPYVILSFSGENVQKYLSYKDIKGTNCGLPIRFSRGSDANTITDLEINGLTALNSFTNANYSAVLLCNDQSGAAPPVRRFRLANAHQVVDSVSSADADKFTRVIDIEGFTDAYIEDSSCFFSADRATNGAIRLTNCRNFNIINCQFYAVGGSAEVASYLLSQLSNSPLLNTFDYTMVYSSAHRTTTAKGVVGASVRFVKQVHTDYDVPASDHVDGVSANVNYETGETGAALVFPIGHSSYTARPCKIKAETSEGDSLELSWDGTSLSEISTNGGLLSFTDSSTKYRLYRTGSYLVLSTNDAGLPGVSVKIAIYDFENRP